MSAALITPLRRAISWPRWNTTIVGMLRMRWRTLARGAEVRFIPEVAAQGRQAKRVSLGEHRVG